MCMQYNNIYIIFNRQDGSDTSFLLSRLSKLLNWHGRKGLILLAISGLTEHYIQYHSMQKKKKIISYKK